MEQVVDNPPLKLRNKNKQNIAWSVALIVMKQTCQYHLITTNILKKWLE